MTQEAENNTPNRQEQIEQLENFTRMITETLEQFTKRINNDIERQRKYGGTIYGAVGKALDNTKTADIAKWFAEQISESWRASSEMMKLSYKKLNAMLVKEDDSDE